MIGVSTSIVLSLTHVLNPYGKAGCGLTYVPVAPVIAHWWKKRRGLALGVVACGSAMGGVFFPIAMRQILPVLG
jgi:MFS family permease